jgi:hypothetical protein
MGQWRQRWQQRLQAIADTLSSPNFWLALVGVVGALLVWFYLFYLAIKHIDTSLAMRSTFCSSEDERNRHILALTLLTPLFLVGLLGVVSEWLTLMENRAKKRKTPLKALVGFSVLLQVSGVFILIALQC